MKRSLALLFIVSLCSGSFAQEDKVKTGWNFGALPAISFNSDLGFQYGALVNFYDYGDGTNYPSYKHSIYAEVSRYTKGSTILRVMYDSDQLIKGIRVTSDLAYLTNDAYDFSGFNGYESVFSSSWEDDESSEYRTRMFYKHQRQLFRFKNDFIGKLSGDNLYWTAGFAIKKFSITSVDIDKLNKGKDAADQLPAIASEPGIYEKYVDWGLLNSDEEDGGLITSFKAGISFDSRDNMANAMKGIWFEAGLEVSPSFTSESSFTRLYAIHRQYFTIIPEDLNFAYRIGYQTTIGGEVPFYYQNQLITSRLTGSNNEGLGGDKSLRGIIQNRVSGDGVLYGNLELRWKAVRFNLINQNIYIGLVGFLDAGMVTKKVEHDLTGVTLVGPETMSDYFLTDAEELHFSTGMGLRLVMNENFIVRADYGKALNEKDGDSGFYIGLNYMF